MVCQSPQHQDTTKSFTLTLPDSLCTVSLTCSGFADGYYNSSTTHSVTIIRTGRKNGSLSGIDAVEGRDFFFTDPRDGHDYLCTTVGSKDWFRENLAFKGSGTPLDNCDAVSDVFGRFYTWNEAVSACPDGWRLSTLDDWADAASTALGSRPDPSVRFVSAAGAFMGDLKFNGTKMWEYWREVTITDDYGLSIMPVGYANVASGDYDFDGLYTYAAFWTADESDGLGVCRYIYHNKDVLYRGRLSKTEFAASVRCVLDLDD